MENSKFKIGQAVKKSNPSLDDREWVITHVSFDELHQDFFYTASSGVHEIETAGFGSDFQAV